jgi:hypothetical protein
VNSSALPFMACHYSPKCLEVEFCELRMYRVLTARFTVVGLVDNSQHARNSLERPGR